MKDSKNTKETKTETSTEVSTEVSTETNTENTEVKEEAKPKVYITPQKKKGEGFLDRIKTMLKMFLHFSKLFLIFTLAILLVALLIMGIYHAVKKSGEKEYLVMSGKQVEVDGRYLHVMTGGNPEADVTLVFLHGDRITDNSVVWQPLWKEIEKECRYFYVDRSGAGFSDSSGMDVRDAETLVTEVRSAAEASGMKGPYILVAEGTSGISALYWANKYPGEVKGIFGLGMVYPEQFDDMETGDYIGFADWLALQLFKIGGSRIFGNMSPTNPAGIFTEAQMNTRQALVYSVGFTKDMYKEDKAMVDSAHMVKSMGWPEDVPVYLLYGNPILEPYLSLDENLKAQVDQAVANGADIKDVEASYYKEERDFFKDWKNLTMKEIPGPVRVSVYAPKEIGVELKSFVKDCMSKQN